MSTSSYHREYGFLAGRSRLPRLKAALLAFGAGLMVSLALSGIGGCIDGKLAPGASQAVSVATAFACDLAGDVQLAGGSKVGTICGPFVELAQGAVAGVTEWDAASGDQTPCPVYCHGVLQGFVRKVLAPLVQAAIDAAIKGT